MMLGTLRYERAVWGGPMQYASSAKRGCSACRSASEKTATVLTPSSRQARMMRTAISPRFATRTLANIIPLYARWLDELRCDCRLRLLRPRGCYKRRSATVNDEHRLAKVHRLPVDDH